MTRLETVIADLAVAANKNETCLIDCQDGGWGKLKSEVNRTRCQYQDAWGFLVVLCGQDFEYRLSPAMQKDVIFDLSAIKRCDPRGFDWLFQEGELARMYQAYLDERPMTEREWRSGLRQPTAWKNYVQAYQQFEKFPVFPSYVTVGLPSSDNGWDNIELQTEFARCLGFLDRQKGWDDFSRSAHIMTTSDSEGIYDLYRRRSMFPDMIHGLREYYYPIFGVGQPLFRGAHTRYVNIPTRYPEIKAKVEFASAMPKSTLAQTTLEEAFRARYAVPHVSLEIPPQLLIPE